MKQLVLVSFVICALSPLSFGAEYDSPSKRTPQKQSKGTSKKSGGFGTASFRSPMQKLTQTKQDTPPTAGKRAAKNVLGSPAVAVIKKRRSNTAQGFTAAMAALQQEEHIGLSEDDDRYLSALYLLLRNNFGTEYTVEVLGLDQTKILELEQLSTTDGNSVPTIKDILHKCYNVWPEDSHDSFEDSHDSTEESSDDGMKGLTHTPHKHKHTGYQLKSSPTKQAGSKKRNKQKRNFKDRTKYSPAQFAHQDSRKFEGLALRLLLTGRKVKDLQDNNCIVYFQDQSGKEVNIGSDRGCDTNAIQIYVSADNTYHGRPKYIGENENTDGWIVNQHRLPINQNF